MGHVKNGGNVETSNGLGGGNGYVFSLLVMYSVFWKNTAESRPRGGVGIENNVSNSLHSYHMTCIQN
jgi:hypothetical protein